MGKSQLVALGNKKKKMAVFPFFAGQMLKDAHTLLFLALTLAQKIITAVALPIKKTRSDADLRFGKNKHFFVF